MKKKTKIIFVLVIIIVTFFILFFAFSYYSIYQYGKKHHLLVEDGEVDILEYKKEKQLLDQ